MFRLLPVQILLAAVSAVNGIVSSFFASNYVGVDAMSAVGLYSPVNMLLTAISTMLMGGSAIIYGRYMGRGERGKLQNVFSLDIILSLLIAGLFVLLFVLCGLLDLTGFMTTDAVVRPIFNKYLLGQAIGLVPMILGNQLSSFLSLENKGSRTTVASVLYILVNVVLNFLLVRMMHMEAFGLALASALGMWVFFGVQAQYFLTKKSRLHMSFGHMQKGDASAILKVGAPGALSYGYQTIRGLIVNWLVMLAVGSVGISAFATADNFLRIFWAVPMGMAAVSRLLISVSIGEEDRQTLTDIMRVMLRRYVPLMCAICAVIIFCAPWIAGIFYRDAAEPVYMMTVWGLRILPLCMPFSIILLHFVCYGQASGKQVLVHILSSLDGVICVSVFTAILIRFAGMNSVYIANVLNGVVTTVVIIVYAWLKNRHFPRSMDELMVIPGDIGSSEDDRMDLTIHGMDEVVTVARNVQNFCSLKGIDRRRSYLAALAMEEMAGNIVLHGFTKDSRKHTVDARVIYKDGDVILRLKDDCIPFDPEERERLADNTDVTKNIGIRMIFGIAKDIRYQNILGLNVLTMQI